MMPVFRTTWVLERLKAQKGQPRARVVRKGDEADVVVE